MERAATLPLRPRLRPESLGGSSPLTAGSRMCKVLCPLKRGRHIPAQGLVFACLERCTMNVDLTQNTCAGYAKPPPLSRPPTHDPRRAARLRATRHGPTTATFARRDRTVSLEYTPAMPPPAPLLAGTPAAQQIAQQSAAQQPAAQQQPAQAAATPLLAAAATAAAKPQAQQRQQQVAGSDSEEDIPLSKRRAIVAAGRVILNSDSEDDAPLSKRKAVAARGRRGSCCSRWSRTRRGSSWSRARRCAASRPR